MRVSLNAIRCAEHPRIYLKFEAVDVGTSRYFVGRSIETEENGRSLAE
jgi:hypothetical protein